MHTYKALKFYPSNPSLQQILRKELGISYILAQLLINRGVTNTTDADKFLNTDLNNLLSPSLFADMPKAVDIIKQVGRNKEKVLIFGDYDVDGITSVVLLKNTLLKMGINAFHYIPHRIKEGYGLSKNILNIARDKNVKLLITVDCGTNSREQIEHLRRANIDIVITDHHEPSSEDVSAASAVINPKIKGTKYGYRDLAGVGVVYKLCQALTNDLLMDDLDLVSLGTIADVVPLNGENRIITKLGLSNLARTNKIGLKALLENCGIMNKKITSTSVSFILGPRINASGRMDTAETALKLMIADEKNEADALAKLLETYNRQRQKIENKIIEEALCEIERKVNFKDHKIIVVANEGWHQGVLGVVASKLADRFYRPAIVISLNDGVGRGSGRSIKNFHLLNALSECKEFLNVFGGHSHAVGLGIDQDNLDDFKTKINLFVQENLRLEDLLPSLDIDMELKLADIDDKVIVELGMLEPFGSGNPEPLFYTRNLKLKGCPQLLSKDTIKFWASDGRFTYQAIGFGKGSLLDRLINADFFDLVYNPRMDSWQGQTSILLEVKDIFFNDASKTIGK